MTSSKSKLTTFWTKFLHNISNPILKDLCKFQIDTTNKCKRYGCSMSIHLYCGSHVGGQENAHQPIFPYNIIENSPTSFARNSVSVVQMTSNFVQRNVLWSYRPHQNLRQMEHNLHNHVFYDVICRPPI